MIIVGNMINFTGELANVFDVFILAWRILSVVVVYRLEVSLYTGYPSLVRKKVHL